jgi:hypothetical protein
MRMAGLFERPMLAMNGLIGRSSATAGMVRIPVNGLAMSAFRTGNDRSWEKRTLPAAVREGKF